LKKDSEMLEFMNQDIMKFKNNIVLLLLKLKTITRDMNKMLFKLLTYKTNFKIYKVIF
jgi:hypothetical protein